MYASVRWYGNSPGLADQLLRRNDEVERVVRTTPGFIAYYLVKTPEGMVTLTLCEKKEGAEQSNRISAEWLRQNLPFSVPQIPEVHMGEVVIASTLRPKAAAWR
jgi:hypothetical protein